MGGKEAHELFLVRVFLFFDNYYLNKLAHIGTVIDFAKDIVCHLHISTVEGVHGFELVRLKHELWVFKT